MNWHLGWLAAFDVESTGINPETARIVTAAVIGIRPQRGKTPADDPNRWLSVDRYGWLSDVAGQDIPAEATAVHGITTEHAHTNGRPARRVVHEISIALADHIRDGVPIIAMNAPYDLTVLDRELERYDLPTLAERAGREPLVVDPLVLDKQTDRYRRGKRTLTHLCAEYSVQLGAAHDSAADALAAAQVADAIARRWPAIADLDLAQLHKAQTEWAREQADSLAAYFARQGRDTTVNRHWPLIPRGGEQ